MRDFEESLVTKSVCLGFFSSCFQKKKKANNILASYKSASPEPLAVELDINVSSPLWSTVDCLDTFF